MFVLTLVFQFPKFQPTSPADDIQTVSRIYPLNRAPNTHYFVVSDPYESPCDILGDYGHLSFSNPNSRPSSQLSSGKSGAERLRCTCLYSQPPVLATNRSHLSRLILPTSRESPRYRAHQPPLSDRIRLPLVPQRHAQEHASIPVLS